MKKGFTLVEIIMVLVIIGVLTAILMPIAFQATPDENVLKFKKSYNTLGTVIRELLTSESFYANGDFSVLSNGSATSTKPHFFCESFAQLVSFKTKDCEVENTNTEKKVVTYDEDADQTEDAKEKLDTLCSGEGIKGAQIVTNDGVEWFESDATAEFEDIKNSKTDANGFDAAYKVFCFDVDGVGKGEDPFGFGIRADGKILAGKRAEEWSQKSIQKQEETNDDEDEGGT